MWKNGFEHELQQKCNSIIKTDVEFTDNHGILSNKWKQLTDRQMHTPLLPIHSTTPK